MDYRTLLIADDAGVRTITINRPDKLNALNRETITELDHAVTAARTDDAVRAIVLTGAGGKAFIAGADITELAKQSPASALEFSRYGQAMMTKFERLGKPVIAKIGGYALGGGLELAMACHLRIASDTAKIGQPEINLGIIPGFGGTQRLLRLAGRAAALELCLTGAQVTAERGYQLGVINRVVPADQLDAETDKLAKQLAASAPHALRGILDSIVLATESALDVGLDYEAQAFGVCVSTSDFREGTSAFLERRKATFSGA